MRDAKKWTKATRVSGGGVHLYIPSETVRNALQGSGLDITSSDLEVAFYALKGRKNRASVLIRLKVGDKPHL